jgi:hypothetical protein
MIYHILKIGCRFLMIFMERIDKRELFPKRLDKQMGKLYFILVSYPSKSNIPIDCESAKVR